MAHRVATVALLLAGLVLFPIRPLVGFILLMTALALYVDGRGAFGRGMFRSMVAFVTALWVMLVGVVATFLGMFDPSCDAGSASCDAPEGNFLFFPGVALLAIGLALLVWSIASALRMRRYG